MSVYPPRSRILVCSQAPLATNRSTASLAAGTKHESAVVALVASLFKLHHRPSPDGTNCRATPIMTRQSQSPILHNTKGSPRSRRLFFISKSTAVSRSTPTNSFNLVDRHLPPPQKQLFWDSINRPRSAAIGPTAAPQLPGLERLSTDMSYLVGMTTEAEFEDLPIAVQRKVCQAPFLVLRNCCRAPANPKSHVETLCVSLPS